MRQPSDGFERELQLIMRAALAFAFSIALLTLPSGAVADESLPAKPRSQQTPVKADADARRPAVAKHDALGPSAGVGPVAISAKRTRARLDLKLSSDRLNRVLNESGVEPVPETDATIDTVEVTAHHVQQEPITQGIPAIYYGITHPTEAWRIFAPIQP